MNCARFRIAVLAAAAAACVGHSPAFAHGSVAQRCTIAPPNDFHLFDDANALANITEAQFGRIIDEVSAIYQPIIASHGGRLVVGKNWNDPTVNAYAEQKDGVWSVEMFGGLARRREVTPDALSLVVCHEVGHHLGGFPLYAGSDDWAAAEGQSDYFATQACAHAIWGDDTAANSRFRAEVPPAAKSRCDATWSRTQERDLCYRTSLAGESLAHLLATLGGDSKPSFATPDPAVVRNTYKGHPDGQCRLDTYFHGALCKIEFDARVIPGRNHPSGQESPEAEQAMDKHSCGGKAGSAVGVRPACWFKSKLHL